MAWSPLVDGSGGESDETAERAWVGEGVPDVSPPHKSCLFHSDRQHGK